MLFGLGDAQYFLKRRDAQLHFAPAVLPEGAHPLSPRCRRQGGGGRPVHHQRPHRLIHHHQFMDAGSPLVAQHAAFIAAHALVERRGGNLRFRETALYQVFPIHPLRCLAMRTDGPDQSLRHDGFHRGGHEEGLDPHVDQTRERAGGVVGVKGAENQMTRQGRADRDLGGLQIANFTDHHHVGILP